MRIRTTQIKWDSDPDDLSGPDEDLPQFVVLDVDHINEIAEIADRLSAMYGWCVESFDYEEVHPLEQLAECANKEES